MQVAIKKSLKDTVLIAPADVSAPSTYTEELVPPE